MIVHRGLQTLSANSIPVTSRTWEVHDSEFEVLHLVLVYIILHHVNINSHEGWYHLYHSEESFGEQCRETYAQE